MDRGDHTVGSIGNPQEKRLLVCCRPGAPYKSRSSGDLLVGLGIAGIALREPPSFLFLSLSVVSLLPRAPGRLLLMFFPSAPLRGHSFLIGKILILFACQGQLSTSAICILGTH